MKREAFRRVLFTMVAAILASPWLTPCSSSGTSSTSGYVPDLPVKQDRDLIYKPAMPGAVLSVQQNQSISRRLLINTEDLEKMVLAKNQEPIVSPESTRSSLRKSAASTLSGFAKVLGFFNPFSLFNRNSNDESYVGVQRRITLSTRPLVLLQGDVVSFAPHENGDAPYLAQASTLVTLANVSITTQDGTIFAMAQRIHFRGPSSEIILEGNPIVKFGHQEIKAARPNALMKLNFATRTVTVSSRAIETKF